MGKEKALANQTVKININGVIYNRVTDENGTAYLAIRLNPKVLIYVLLPGTILLFQLKLL